MPRPTVLPVMALTALAAAAGLLAAVGAPEATAGPDGLVVAAAVWGLRAAVAYLFLCAGVLGAGIVTGRRRRLPGTPRWLVRAVDVALGTVLVVGSAPALADGGPAGPSTGPVAEGCATDLPPLGWPTTPAETPGVTATHVVVRPGDSLWSIAAGALGRAAAPAGVAAEWPRWWRHNRSVVGPDPDRITPGQRLAAPPTPTRRAG